MKLIDKIKNEIFWSYYNARMTFGSIGEVFELIRAFGLKWTIDYYRLVLKKED